MTRYSGYFSHRKTALALGVLLVALPASAQEMLPVPGLSDQLSAQQSPLAAQPAQDQTPLQPQIQAQLQAQQQTPQPQAQVQMPLAQPAQNAPAAPPEGQLNQMNVQPTPSAGADPLQAMRERAQQSASQGRMGQQQAQQQQQPQAAAGGAGDALPEVRNIRVQTDGMDYIGNQTLDLQIRDTPVNQYEEDYTYQQGIREEAFSAAADGMFPLRTDEIREILRRYDETRRAVETPHYDMPRPEVKVETISLDPGITPPVINTAVGHVTTLTMLDVTGAPWPIQDVSWAGDFEVVEPEAGGHIIRITPMANFAYGNVSMRLLTLKTPVTFTLKTARDVVQYRFDARIPEYGPMAEAQLIDAGHQIAAGDKMLTQILDGIVPAGAERLDVSGVDGRTTALLAGGTTYLRTPLTLLSPAWDSSVKSADGMNVYAMAETPVVLLSDGGKFRRATLRAKEGLFDE